MKEQTIYSYKLIYRFRWRGLGFLLQGLTLFVLLGMFSVTTDFPLNKLLVSLSVVVIIPVAQFALFRLFAYTQSHTVRPSLNQFVSAWWGTSTPLPVSLRFFRGVEATVCAGSLLIAATLYVWLPYACGVALLAGTIVLILPRVLVLLISLRQPKHCSVKYEARSISFLLTDG